MSHTKRILQFRRAKEGSTFLLSVSLCLLDLPSILLVESVAIELDQGREGNESEGEGGGKGMVWCGMVNTHTEGQSNKDNEGRLKEDGDGIYFAKGREERTDRLPLSLVLFLSSSSLTSSSGIVVVHLLSSSPHLPILPFTSSQA